MVSLAAAIAVRMAWLKYKRRALSAEDDFLREESSESQMPRPLHSHLLNSETVREKLISPLKSKEPFFFFCFRGPLACGRTRDIDCATFPSVFSFVFRCTADVPNSCMCKKDTRLSTCIMQAIESWCSRKCLLKVRHHCNR